MKLTNLCKTAVYLTLGLVAQRATADMASTTQRIASEIGTQEAITATATCEMSKMVGEAGGNLGLVNQILCVMKILGINSTTPSGGTTMDMPADVGLGKVHFELNAPGATVDGVTYSYEMKIWTCGENCDSASNYYPAIYITFDATSDKTVNKGVLINNFSASSGQIKGSSFVKWNTGTAATTRTIDMIMMDCSGTPGGNYVQYSRTGTKAALNEIHFDSGAVNRSTLAWDTSSNVGNWQSDSVSNSGGDTVAWDGGFSRVASGTDYTYSAASTDSSFTFPAYPTAFSGTTLMSSTYGGISCSSIYTTGVPAITTGAGMLTTPMIANGGMDTHPSSI